jgi:alpha-beta hydrolase superfamily lysophospholipase
MGAILAFNLAARQPAVAAGIILISPVFKSILNFPLTTYLQIPPALLFNPRKTVDLPFTSAMCTRDVAYQEKMNADPRELRVASIKLLIGILAEQTRATGLAAKLTVPALFLLSGRDAFGDIRTSRAMFARIGGRDKDVREYPDMLHALSIDQGRERVFADILAWMRKRI